MVWFDRNLLSSTRRVKIFRKSKIYVEGNLLRWTTSGESKNQKIKDANAFKLFLLVLNWFWISPKNRYCQNPFYAKIYVESLCQETIIFSAFHCYDSLASDTLNHNVAVWRFTRTWKLFTFPVTETELATNIHNVSHCLGKSHAVWFGMIFKALQTSVPISHLHTVFR